MFRLFQRPIPLVLLLVFLTAIPILNSLVLVFQVPSGTLAEDSAHLAVAPISLFVHVLAGVAFGITGPVQFVRALRNRFGALHRVSGRIFVLSGTIIGLSGLSILAQVTSQRTPIVDIARGLFGLALLIALAMAMAAVWKRDFRRHRAWAIRSYAIGMGLGTVALVFIPLYIITGQPPIGPLSDILFVVSWVLTIVIADTAYYSEQRGIVAGGGDVPDGVVVTSDAFESFLPQFPVILAIAVALFAFSTLITWSYYTQKAWTALVGRSPAKELGFKIVFCCITVIGTVISFGSVLTFADSMLFVCAIFNLLGCYLLLPVVRREMRSFLDGLKSGEISKVPKDERTNPASTLPIVGDE